MRLTRSAHADTHRRLVDAVIDGYVTWREESFAVDVSYRRWKHASSPEQAAAFDEYAFALEREERAASEYRRRIEEVSAVSRP
jgi:hypothetical protein